MYIAIFYSRGGIMLEEIEKINRLAENLKKTGLAANISDAVEIAKKIIEKGKEKEEVKYKLEVSRDSLDYNVSKEKKTVKELLSEESEKAEVEEIDDEYDDNNKEREPLRVEDLEESKEEE